MEGMQIALYAVVNLPEDELKEFPVAHATCELAFHESNLQAFLIGRQICVTLCMFLVARLSTLDVAIGEEENTFDVSDSVQRFFNTGLLGAIITTIVASLAFRIVASSFPVAFLSNPVVYLMLRLCLVLESSGLCSASWLLAYMIKKLFRFQDDTEYMGSPKERQRLIMDMEAENAAKEAAERGGPPPPRGFGSRRSSTGTVSQPSMNNSSSYRSTALVFDPSVFDQFKHLCDDDDEDYAGDIEVSFGSTIGLRTSIASRRTSSGSTRHPIHRRSSLRSSVNSEGSPRSLRSFRSPSLSLIL